ncbi:uncharacterized protein LOC115749773 isoform X2 [Rhodamnia argentea]|uniref:Uncharacterized protein LOC115749773 isoform X2 n=1 Tax=Rhodamnia argentea TaxID=178133 RepID=A0ABM3HR48_9MYRT|nr:uncharacterized protein LOC115749773 isoform X2 [Rhodamnia argentea]
MTSEVASYSIDDKDLDDATLWALMDSAAASLSSKPRKLLPIKHSTHQSPTPVSYHSPPALTFSAKCNKRAHHSPRADSDSRVLRDGEVVQEPVDSGYRPLPPPQKIARSWGYEASEASPLPLVRSAQRTPTTPMRSSPEAYLSPEISRSAMSSPGYYVQSEEKEVMRHCLNGKFPTVSLFKEYQNAAMAILEKTDYTMISGNPFIKKSGVVDFLMVGAHASGERRDFQNQIMISLVQQKLEPKIRPARTC